MARIAGVELPHHKRMEIALTYIYGIGRSAAQKILAEAKVDPARNSDELTPEEQPLYLNMNTPADLPAKSGVPGL